jgi:hypothetical protein
MPKSTLTREQADLQHLTLVLTLSGEVASAISAVEHNHLHQLQVAIANQERICDQLANTKWTPPSSARKRAGSAHRATSEIGERIQAAYVALAQLNRVYAGVVKRSQRSVELLSALYGNGAHGYGQQPPRPETSQTLSCEA